MSYDGDLQHDPGWGRSREENERIRDEQIAIDGPHSHLDIIIGQQCEEEAEDRSIGDNIDVYEDRTSRGENANRTLKVLYRQIKRFFGR